MLDARRSLQHFKTFGSKRVEYDNAGHLELVEIGVPRSRKRLLSQCLLRSVAKSHVSQLSTPSTGMAL